MKNILLALAILSTSFSLQAQTKVGTIDADFILSQMPEIISVEEEVKTYTIKLQEDLETTIKKYEEMVANYQTNNATFTDEEKKAKESEIISVENDIKNFRQKATVLMQVRRNELTQPLYAKMDTAMKAVIEKENYTQVFNTSINGMAYADEKYDITEAVMKNLGIELPKE